MLLSLIGYRGTGKTSVAPRLAARLGWDWTDADEELERRAGCTIKQVFAAEGEAGFRRREREVLQDLLRRDRLVVAAGGGAILNAETRRELVAAGPVVWLKAAVNTIADRIAGDATTSARRPQLTSAGGVREIEQLLAAREPFYRECASLELDTEGLGVEEIVERIVTFLRTKNLPGA
jgi:shikimate kinase